MYTGKFLSFKSLHLESAPKLYLQPQIKGLQSKKIKSKTLKLFSIFLTTSTRPIKNTFKVHPSAKVYFMSYNRLSTAVFSITRLYSKWQDFYFLMYNIHVYKLPLITLGNSVFKDELLSMNWSLKTKLQGYWSQVKPYIFLKKNRINNYNGIIFSLLKLKRIDIALVIDTNYHQSTLFYLQRYSFFTIGVVPVTSNLYKVNFALPSSAESTYSHLFFIRVILNIRKNVALDRFKASKNHWLL